MAETKPQTQPTPNYPTCTFADIETVRSVEKLTDISERMMELYVKRNEPSLKEKYQIETRDDLIKAAWDHYVNNAALSAEFGKIVCVSMGKYDQKASKFYVKSICGANEKELLIEFGKSLQRSQTDKLCAHNGLEFDFPFLERRYMINGLHIPNILCTFGKKTWEYPFFDTVSIYSGSAWKYRISLDLSCEIFGIESPKGEMDGSKVGEIWYNKELLPFDKEEKISTYCNGDVIANAKLFCKMRCMDVFTDEQIEIIGAKKQA